MFKNVNNGKKPVSRISFQYNCLTMWERENVMNKESKKWENEFERKRENWGNGLYLTHECSVNFSFNRVAKEFGFVGEEKSWFNACASMNMFCK